jgi:hypothetical protein
MTQWGAVSGQTSGVVGAEEGQSGVVGCEQGVGESTCLCKGQGQFA